MKLDTGGRGFHSSFAFVLSVLLHTIRHFGSIFALFIDLHGLIFSLLLVTSVFCITSLVFLWLTHLKREIV